MFRKKLKQLGACALALSMVLGSAEIPSLAVFAAEESIALENEVAAKSADSENLALSATATASSVEASTLPATQANDGDSSTRWASDVSSDEQWLQLSWSSVQTVKSFIIKWERRNATAYAIETSTDGTNWNAVASFTAKPTKTTQEITLDAAVQAQYVRLNVTGHEAAGLDDETSWNNVSVYELEVYEGEIPDTTSEMEKLAASIQAPTVSADGTHITMPEVGEGVTVTFCADYEQVVGEDGTIYTPLQDKTIKGCYKVTKGEESAQTEEFTIVIPGKYTDDAKANAKPDVIPELQEWHGETGNYVLRSSSRIVVTEDLKDTAEIVASDLEELTGKQLSVVVGSEADVRTGDFYFTLETDDKGLGDEGYIMTIGDYVKVEASTSTGAYWGAISAEQIIKQTGNTIPKGITRDYPKYEVRAFSLDIGRKAFSLETLNDFAKNMAWYKMNSFQVHLSDNLIFFEDYATQEEAIEQAYGGFRLESGVVSSVTGETATATDVYYSKDEFRSFVKSSKAMGVEIVPEIDMPAHAWPLMKAFPEYRTTKTVSNGSRYRIDELDLSNPETTEWAKSIWADLFEGDDPVFDEDTTIHIGTDEYHGTDGQQGIEEFRQFSADMIEYIQSTGRTVRMWGSLSNKSGTTEVPSENVQLNIWNTGYADPQTMYDLGYDLINTLEGWNYIVPAAGYYNDYISAQNIYNNWKPNSIGNLTLSAGDDQMLGGCYAIWHDSIDTRANGISEYDSFDRFFQPLGAYSAKLWGDAADKTYSEFAETFQEIGTAPGTDIYGEVDSVSETVLDYTFDENLSEDSSGNDYDAQGESKNVSQTVVSGDNQALQLNGGESYITTTDELNKVGMSSVLTMRVKMDADAEGEQILCESTDEFGTYGTYAIKAVQKNTGKVGFSREGYDYSFDYTLPKDEWVTLTFVSGKDNVALYVNGELVDDDPDIYFANHPTTELSATLTAKGITKVSTMLLPLGRIGSTTNSFKGEIDYLTVTSDQNTDESYRVISQSEMTAEACTANSDGLASAALDGDSSTIWHTNYTGTTDNITDDHNHWFKVTLNNAAVIDKITVLPRQTGSNGYILTYNVEVTKPDGTVVTVVENGTWASDSSLKTATFDPIEAKEVKLVITDATGNSSTKFASMAEFNVYKSLQSSDMAEILAPFEALNEADYTTESWAAFSQALEEAKKLAENVTSTSADLQAAVTKLNTLKDRLTEKETDVTDLFTKIDQAAAADTAGCDSKYITALESAIADAKAALASETVTQEEVAAAIKALADAQAPVNLTKEVNETVDLTGMTKTSAAAYQAALADAKALLASDNATAAQFEAAQANLVSAKAGLTKETEKNAGAGTEKNTDKTSAETKVPAVGTTKTIKNITYKVTKSDAANGTVTVTGMQNKNAKKAVIPSTVTIDGTTFKVTAVAAKAFQNSKKLANVTIGANVTSIGAKAFYKCAKLSKLTFKGTKAAKIGKQAFKGSASKCTVTLAKKMAKKQQTKLKKSLKKAGVSSKAAYKVK